MSETTPARPWPTSAEEWSPAQQFRADAGLFAVSCAILTLEILQIKIFGFSLNSPKVYLAIGICQLGLGASATLLALGPPVARERARELGAICAAAGAATLPIVHVLFGLTSDSFIRASPSLILILAALSVPYLLFGGTVALSLVSRAADIGRAYAVNLAGSAMGCVIVYPLLEALGAERALAVTAILALMGGLLLATPATASRRAFFGFVAVGLGALCWIGPSLLDFRPDPRGQISTVQRRAVQLASEHPDDEVIVDHLWQRWDRTGRVDVYRVDTTIPELGSRVGGPLETLFYVQDASAGSYLIGVGDDLKRGRELFEGTLYGLGYSLGARKNVLVIGLGGAPDVLTALHHGAERITGVEINAAAIDLVSGEFAAFLGYPYSNPSVQLHRIDGRTFLRSTNETFDLIQLSGVDTKSALSSGSMAVNENYLYTFEAMLDMLGQLEPGGAVSFIRFGDYDAHRLSSIAVEALRQLGAERPERHIAIVAQGFLRGVVIKRSPLSEVEVERLYAWVDEQGGEAPDVVIPALEWIGLSFKHPMRILYLPPPREVASTWFLKALAAGTIDDAVANAKSDLSPPTDDRPFFFLHDRAWQALTNPSPILENIYLTVAQLAGVSALFILAPLLILRRRGLRTPLAGRSMLYFGSLGTGFMLIEIGLIHRFVLLLGHSSYSVTVVLLGLLVGASAGSSFSRRLSIDEPRDLRLALIALVSFVVLLTMGTGSLFEATAELSFELRLFLSLLILTTLGFLMGIPFPTALRSLDATSRPLVAWCIGVNGFASVIGATAAVPIAMVAGLSVLMLLGVSLYSVALVAAPVGGAGRAGL